MRDDDSGNLAAAQAPRRTTPPRAGPSVLARTAVGPGWTDTAGGGTAELAGTLAAAAGLGVATCCGAPLAHWLASGRPPGGRKRMRWPLRAAPRKGAFRRVGRSGLLGSYVP